MKSHKFKHHLDIHAHFYQDLRYAIKAAEKQ